MDKTTDKIYELLIRYIRAATKNASLKILVGNQRGNEPTGEYCTMMMVSNQSLGLGITEENEDPEDPEAVILTSSSTYETKISIQFYRGNAHEYARRLMHFPNTEHSYYILAKTNVTVSVPSSYRNIDESLHDGWISRTQIDLTLRSTSEYVETVGLIDEVDVLVSNKTVNEDKVEI